MKRILTVAVLAGCGGFCLASTTAWAYAKLNAWQSYGEYFQLGYVVGYRDAARLAQFHDPRGLVPTVKLRPERWRELVNEFFADPANAKRSLPDAMGAVSEKLRRDLIQASREREERQRSGDGSADTNAKAPDAKAKVPDANPKVPDAQTSATPGM